MSTCLFVLMVGKNGFGFSYASLSGCKHCNNFCGGMDKTADAKLFAPQDFLICQWADVPIPHLLEYKSASLSRKV